MINRNIRHCDFFPFFFFFVIITKLKFFPFITSRSSNNKNVSKKPVGKRIAKNTYIEKCNLATGSCMGIHRRRYKKIKNKNRVFLNLVIRLLCHNWYFWLKFFFVFCFWFYCSSAAKYLQPDKS